MCGKGRIWFFFLLSRGWVMVVDRKVCAYGDFEWVESEDILRTNKFIVC
jgi:hypothetical protein